MKDISANATTYHSSKDVAKQLNISPVTLKKYSLLIEKLSNGAVTYVRNDDKSRVYADTDVLLITRTLELRDTEGITFENAVIKALIEQNILAVPPVPNGRTPAVPSNDLSSVSANDFLAVLQEQNAHIGKLLKSNEELVQSNKELSEKMQLLIDKVTALEEPAENIEEPTPPKKKRWWQIK